MVIIAGVVYWLVGRPKPTSLDKQVYRQDWRALAKYIKNQDSLPLAVIEADKLLDRALKDSRFKGETMANRLVIAGSKFSDRDRVWAAHKLRNQLVHESSAQLTLAQTKTALKAFERALKDLGALWTT